MGTASTPHGRFMNILEIAEEGIVTLNERQQIVFFNHGAEKVFGYAGKEVVGEQFDLLLPKRYAETHRRHVQEFAASDRESRLMGERRVVVGLRKDGTEFPAEVSICKFRENGELLFAAIFRDVSERRKQEEATRELNRQLEERVNERTVALQATNMQLHDSLTQLQSKTEELRSTSQQLWQAAKLASVGELAASIAHELNNPLGTVSLRVESILASTTPEDPRRHALEVVEQEVERMARLVANLLQFSRSGNEQASTVNVSDELVMTTELTQHHLKRRGIEVLLDFEENLPAIFADRQKLRQVFLNLFTNAVDAMPAGGALSTRVRRSGTTKKPSIQIEVADTGTGIPPEIIPKVMDPFFTTKEEGKGTGLGLAICKRIVQEHQGNIQIESEVGKGTMIRITLPVSTEKNIARLT